MSRIFNTFQVANPEVIKVKMLNWCKQFNIFCLLDNQASQNLFDCLIGAGAQSSIIAQAGNAFNSLEEFKNHHQDWIFGHLAYELKAEVEDLNSSLPDNLNFPHLHFFVPEVLIILYKNELKIGSYSQAEISRVYTELCHTPINITDKKNNVSLKSRLTKTEYLEIIDKLKSHILNGDCYEINFCQEFFSEGNALDPFHTFQILSEISPNPFAAFYRYHNKYLLCQSPERFLKKEGQILLSQPIKGTAKRNYIDKVQDEINKNSLHTNVKELSENVMITDLVRNDLSKVSIPGSVMVRELQGLYTFPHVHQMISTVVGKLATQNFAKILRATFPMGSMTGAPKKRVMEIIEKYETNKRGLFSGSIGYITPNGDFDFNVVIRSILYNGDTKYISVSAGSAITINSDANNEYEECLIKISPAIKSLTS